MLDQILEIAEQPYSDEDAEWDAFVAAHPNGSLLQTTGWARLKNRFGWTSQRVWLRRDGRLVAGAQLLFRSAPLGLMRMAYVPHGPLVDWRDDEQVAVMLNQIDVAAYRRRAGMIKMEPLLWLAEGDGDDGWRPAAWAELCRRHACRPAADAIQPPRSVLVNLRPEPDEILAAMKPKARYNIRLAARKGVRVRAGTAADLPLFNQLVQHTGRRNGFGVHIPAYYRSAYEIFAPDGDVALLIAEFEERPLAAIMVFKNGPRAAYLYGGSNDEERARMPTYAVQWAAMEWARAQGCETYDLWGVPDASPAELEAGFQARGDGLWGVYRFKRGFGGDVRRAVGAVDRVNNRLFYRIYQWWRNRSAA